MVAVVLSSRASWRGGCAFDGVSLAPCITYGESALELDARDRRTTRKAEGILTHGGGTALNGRAVHGWHAAC
jgi:hypothetical protein